MSMTYKNILVAVDGSIESMVAFKRAVQVAFNNVGSWLYIIHVIDTRSFAFSEGYNYDLADRYSKSKKDMLDGYEEVAVKLGFDRTYKIMEYGTPKHIIARDIPKQKQIDLIICGATGKGDVARFFLGSVSEAIVRTAKCDVLVVRNR